MTLRRKWTAPALLLAALTAGGLAIALRTGDKTRTLQSATVTKQPPRRTPPAVETGLLPWRLAAPLSREVVVSKSGTSNLLILGGLTPQGSTNGVYALDTRTGARSPHGTLVTATHDAAGATLGRRALVIGGGAAVPVASTQVEAGAKTVTGGAIPQARADAGAVTIGHTVYVVGGYDGSALDREVIATTDGRSYRPVAALPIPVRYPALAVLASSIFVFGGIRANGTATNVVQRVDPSEGTARVVGRLPVPLAGAAAAVLGGTIYLAGGRSTSALTAAVYAFEPQGSRFLRAGSLRIPVAYAGAAVKHGRLWIVGGETGRGRATADVQMIVPNRRFGSAGDPAAGSPFFGNKLLIADRGNDRLLVLSDTDKVVWTYPTRGRPVPRGGFYFPDDAFFIRHGTAIISNQEDNNTIVEIGYPSGRILFRYGHPRAPGTAPGYLNTPDDAYLLRNGHIAVADAGNCRVLIIDAARKRVVRQIGSAGRCFHAPPRALGPPNGDTPLAGGGLLVSEINGSWVDKFTASGRLVWAAHLAIGYPSDPQQIGRDRYLIADYEAPGGIVEFDRRGHITYRYQPSSGPGELDHPSLVELLPSGVFMLNDDKNDRMVAIDPVTRALVWQYGRTASPGRKPGMLNTPDGFDLVQPNGRTPTHPATG